MKFYFELIFIFILFLFPSIHKGNNPCSSIVVPNNDFQFTNYNLTNQTPSGYTTPLCGTYFDSDLWLSFIAPANGDVTIQVQGITQIDPAFAVYSGTSCDNLTPLGCFDDQKCGQIPNPAVSFLDLIPGATYYIRIWGETPGGGTVKVRLINPGINNFINSGNAVSLSNNCIRLTQAANGQNGCTWYQVPSDFAESFELNFTLFFGASNTGADGICLVFSPNQFCGGTGGGIGAIGIPNSLIIEFDTFFNGAPIIDIADDHIAINYNGIMDNPEYGPFSINGGMNIEDNMDHDVKFEWDASLNRVRVYFDGTLILDQAGLDVVNSCFAGNSNVFWGMTAGTGGSVNEHRFCYEDVLVDNTAPLNEEIAAEICEGEIYSSPAGNMYTETEIIIEDFTDVNGCSAKRRIDLEVLSRPTKSISANICAGSSYDVGNESFTDAAQYEFYKNALVGCDTLVTLSLYVYEFAISAEKLTDLDCDNPTTNIIATLYSANTYPPDFIFGYQWNTADGEIVSGYGSNEITVSESGTYNVTLYINIGSETCISNQEFEIIDDFSLPPATITQGNPLDCNNLVTTLTAEGNLGNNVFYEWYTEDGDITSNVSSKKVDIYGGGNYYVIISNINLTCIDTVHYEVLQTGFNANVLLSSNQIIDCTNKESEITAQIVQSDSQNYSWETTNGNIVITSSDKLKITVDKAGTYTFIVQGNGNCFKKFSFIIEENIEIPQISAGLDKNINCKIVTEVLNGSVTTPGSDFEPIWYLDGNVVSQNWDLTTQNPGSYILEVKNSSNGCISRDTVLVSQNVNDPIINEVEIPQITCNLIDPVIVPDVLNAQNSTYSWVSNTGVIVGNSNQASVTINTPDTYTLIVQDTISFCSDTIDVVVLGSRIIPDVQAGNDQALDCTLAFVTITGSFTAGNDQNQVESHWSTIDGNIINIIDLYTVEASNAGTYIFTAINMANGCLDQDTILITANIDKPNILIEGEYVLNCIITQIEIQAQIENAGTAPTITWTEVTGNIINENGAAIIVDQIGEYIINVKNEDSDCFSESKVTVIGDFDQPVANILEADDLTCNVLNVDIQLESLMPVQILWSTQNGQIDSDPTQLIIQVSSEGIYEVHITDPLNGCKDTLETVILKLADYPDIEAGSMDTLNCKIKEVNLNGVIFGNSEYDILWEEINNKVFENNALLNPIIYTPGTYILNVTDVENGCKSTDTVTIIQRISEPIIFDPIVTQANCDGLKGAINIEVIQNGISPYQIWLNGVAQPNNTLTFEQLKADDYTIELEDALGCKTEFQTTIQPSGDISFEIPDTVFLDLGDSYIVDPQLAFDEAKINIISWNGPPIFDCIDCLEPTLSPTVNTNVTLTIKDSDGCIATRNMYLIVKRRLPKIFIPNTFSPFDLNNINDRVTVFADEKLIPIISEFKIFNRWGICVFSNDDFPPNQESIGWNGVFLGKFMNPDVFTFYVKCRTIYGEDLLQKGDITILE